jgi:hypothetical protein
MSQYFSGFLILKRNIVSSWILSLQTFKLELKWGRPSAQAFTLALGLLLADYRT